MKPYTEPIPGTDVKVEMVPIPGGKFKMGSPKNEKGHKDDEGPQHEVKIEPFWMETHEVNLGRVRVVGLGPGAAAARAEQDRHHRPRQGGRRRGPPHPSPTPT